MRIALIGCQNHWHNYVPALEKVPGACIAGVAPGAPEERLDAFAVAPGVTTATPRFDDACRMLDTVKPDLVQVSTSLARMGRWNREAVRRGIPVYSEKPIAFTLEELAETWAATGHGHVPLAAGQGMQGAPAFEAVRAAVQAGHIGEAFNSYHQKSYRWGARPDWYRDRRTFPGLVPWVGIHALAWMHWILGDVFTEVSGWETAAPRSEFPACAAQAGLVLRQRNGGCALLSLDYLRPAKAPTHGDERLRIAGALGVVEAASSARCATLITQSGGAEEVSSAEPPLDGLTRFALSLTGQAEAPMQTWETFRVTELALLAQRALDEGRPVALRTGAYSPPAR